MIVTDSGFHVWEPPTAERPWDVRKTPIPEPMQYEDVRVRMAEAGVDRAILVPPTFAGAFSEHSFEAAAKYPEQFAVMGAIHLNRPDGPEYIKKLIGQGAIGVRVTFHHTYDETWVRDGTSDWFWPLAEKMNFAVMVNGPTVHQDIAKVAERHPALRLIYDHMGLPKKMKDDKFAPALASTLELARLPNIFVKMTNLQVNSTQGYPYRNLFPGLKQLIETFGPRRCFWGTNLSSMMRDTKCTYRQAVTMFTQEMDFLSKEDLEWVMGRALAECLPWPVAAGLASKKSAA